MRRATLAVMVDDDTDVDQIIEKRGMTVGHDLRTVPGDDGGFAAAAGRVRWVSSGLALGQGAAAEILGSDASPAAASPARMPAQSVARSANNLRNWSARRSCDWRSAGGGQSPLLQLWGQTVVWGHGR